jgi:phosphoserine aminotransferase
MTSRVYNFSAGPAMLPLSALEEARRDLLALPEVGMSVLEISHRSKCFTAILEEAESNIRALLGLSDRYHVLFLPGGASLQFSMLAMNLLRGEGRSADYLVTGSWGAKAVKEAQKEGTTRVLFDGKDENYVRAPEDSEIDVDSNATYLHYTSNETIQGVQYPREPETGDVPLVCDASSDFLSRPVAIERYGILYAGAQKNVGPAGLAVAIVREDMLERIEGTLPSMLDYRVMAENDSCYNTPPVFTIYFIMLSTRWLLNTVGGLDKMAELNQRKAQPLYDLIDGSGGFYQGHAKVECRSMMNVPFRLADADLDATFLEESTAQGLCELKGHRSVGGMRASIYNAMPPEGVQTLCEFMRDFQERHASAD